MGREPKVYIAVENEAGQLIVHGPLELLDQLVTTLAGQGGRRNRVPEPAAAPEPCAAADVARPECATAAEDAHV